MIEFVMHRVGVDTDRELARSAARHRLATIRNHMDVSTTTSVMIGLPVAVAGSAVAQDFLKRVFGPVGDEVGKALAHPLQQWNERRVHRGAEALESAARMLNDADRMASAVPGRVLLPLLEAVSLEDDAHLRGMWVTLLANAADSVRGGDMLPAFVSILKELSPVEALILENVYLQHGDDTRRIDYNSDNPSARFNPATIKIFAGEGKEFVEVELPFRNYRVVADNLMRLGLVEQQFSGATYGSEASHRVYSELTLTPLGHHLIQSCIKLSP